MAAIERLAQLDDDSALTLYRAARAADPGFFTAQYEYIALMGARFRGPELRREFATNDSSSALKLCLAAGAEWLRDADAATDRLLAIEARFGPTPCTDAVLVGTRPEAYSAARAARAMRDSPRLMGVWGTAALRLWEAGRVQAADQALVDGIKASDNPLHVIGLTIARASAYGQRADTAGALAIWSSLGDWVRRDGRPGPMAAYLGNFCNGQVVIPGASAHARADACRQFYAIVRPRRAWFTEWAILRLLGKTLLEHGDITAAAPVLSRSVLLADSLGTPGLQLDSYTVRGRAFAKSGKIPLALRDLRRAIAVAPAAELPYNHADAYHNLAHTYEGAGRFTEAAFAADTFAAIAATIRHSSLRWISRHDAGTIRWSAGWHAAATRDFDAMVRIVDEPGIDGGGHVFAGEYFERKGDLGLALHYYGVDAHKQSPEARSLAALARIYDALGSPDSAEAAARAHDADDTRWPILERPLMPDLLAKRGRVREAIAIADAWARRQMTGGNIEGAAIAQLGVAELHLLNRDPKAALVAASRGDSLSRMLRLTAQTTKARTLEGRALFEDGRRAEGLAALREAVRLATAHPSTEALRSTNLALGNALDVAGNRADALAAYDRAGVAVERMTAGLNDDANRTGFKSLHLAPFDGALRLLFRGTASTADAEAALEWSARRKGASLMLAGEPGVARRRLSVAALRAQLRPDEALIDYTVQDSAVAAIIVTPQSTTRVRLGVSPAQLRAWIAALRRPLVATPGGRIDLAHAIFNAAVAESLYRALIVPIQPRIAGVSRLAIVPDGALWHVPFPALVTAREGARVTYLIERYETRLLPSALFLGAAERIALPANFRVDAFVHSVPGGEDELAAIRAALGAKRVLAREGPRATEREALNASGSVLHMAVHGIVDDRDALASHLLLAPEGGDDGLLHLTEVANRRGSPQLVVLTACEAVNGKLFAGEGLVGLARAFLLGGARQVIASEWPVDASASVLTGALYRELARGQGPSAALRSAQRALLRDPRTAHPIHWAGFVAFDAGAAPR